MNIKQLITSLLTVIFVAACGGGGYGSSGTSGTSGTTSYGSGSAPTGSFSGQVDPVQTTNN